ncbi:hypothetical protein ACYATP_02740 [Lactobacillaceae bacterium Melli_B4]
MRGTWYGFESGKLYKTTFYKNKIVNNYDGKKHTTYVHKYKDHDVKTADKKTDNWVLLTNTNKIHGYKWVKSYGWNQNVGSANYFSVNTFNGNKVLSSAGNAGVEVDSQYYRTPDLAKQLANKKYPSFKYSSEF